MTAFDSESSKQANAKQHQNYPDLPAEMRRRASLRRTRGSGANVINYGGVEGLANEMSRRARIRWDKHAKNKDGQSR